MKITNFAILFVLIMLPFFVQNHMKVRQLTAVMSVKERLDVALDTAVQDGAKALIWNARQERESQYRSDKFVRMNKEAAVEAFFSSLYLNFGVFEDPYGQQLIHRYVPAIAVIGYDGYFIYYEEEVKDPVTGEVSLRHVWSAKQPYTFEDISGVLLSFTLDDFVIAHNPANQTWHEGFRAELATKLSISFLQNADVFDQIRRSVIVRQIQEDLERTINRHNKRYRRADVQYTFTLPITSTSGYSTSPLPSLADSIPKEEWDNTINDSGLIAFLQGIPIGDQTYNNYALGGSRIVKRSVYYGASEGGILYYYPSTCPAADAPVGPVIETFSTAVAAAREGYFPWFCDD